MNSFHPSMEEALAEESLCCHFSVCASCFLQCMMTHEALAGTLLSLAIHIHVYS